MTYRSVIQKFNRGEVSPLALARDDVQDVVDTCELQDNFMPIRLGPMRYRPGFEHIGSAYGSTTNRALIPLTRSIGDTVLFEFADGTMRPLVDGLPIACSTASISFTNESFTSGGGGWTLGGSASLATDKLNLGTDSDYGHQTSGAVTAGVLQTFRCEVTRGVVRLQIGDGSGVGASDLYEGLLAEGNHYIQFKPAATSFSITVKPEWKFLGDGYVSSQVNHCGAVASGNIEFTVPNLDYRKISYDTSADVMFLALGEDNEPKVIKRSGLSDRSEGSYSVEKYNRTRGPYQGINTGVRTIYSSGQDGERNLTASAAIFDTTSDLGRFFKLAFVEQIETADLSTVGAITTQIEVLGYGEDRELLVKVVGASASNTADLKRIDPRTGVTDVIATYTTDTAEIVTDRFDGERRRYYLESTGYSSGTFTGEIQYVSPSVHGHGELTEVSSTTAAKILAHDVIPRIGSTNTTVYWYRGAWGPGSYPQGVTLYEGRLCWASKNRIDMTETDDYYSFDTEVPGDSAAISRTIGFGPVEDIAWLESTRRMYLGLPNTEVMVRSSNFDEPLTPTNTNLKPGKGTGSKAVRALASDDRVYFVSRDGERLHELSHDIATDTSVGNDLMMLHPTICEDGIEAMAVSKHPETRLWVVTSTGELRVLLREPTEQVQAWSRITTDGTVKDVCVVPQTGEDEVWIIVTRTNGTYIEKLSAFTATEPMDSFKRYSSPGTATLTGLTHLEGETVGVWADGQDRGTFTVSSGQITVASDAYTTVIVGLPYTAKYKSNKLSQYVSDSVIGERKRVTNTALVMRNYAPGALRIGPDQSGLVDLPGSVAGAMVTDYDEQKFSFPGRCDTDSRIYMEATGPCEIMALAYHVNLKQKQANG